MKIAIITNAYPNREKETMSGAFVEERARHYRELGEEVAVFAKPIGRPEASLEIGIQVFRYPLKEAIREVQRFSPDVLAVHAPHRYSVRLAMGLPFPKALWFHGWEVEIGHPVFDALPFPARFALRAYDFWKLSRLKRLIGYSGACIFNSYFLKQRAERNLALKLDSEKTFVIPNPVPSAWFSLSAPGPQNMPPAGICLAALKAHKGIDVLVRALASTRHTRVVVYGKGREKEKIEGLIRQLKSAVELREETVAHERLPQLLGSFDYAVLPSRYEPQGLFLMEAMACGIPAVGTRTGGIPEYLKEGINGHLAEPGDPSSLRRAIEKLLEGGRMRQLGEKAREEMKAFCSAHKIIPLELEVMRMVSAGFKG